MRKIGFGIVGTAALAGVLLAGSPAVRASIAVSVPVPSFTITPTVQIDNAFLVTGIVTPGSVSGATFSVNGTYLGTISANVSTTYAPGVAANIYSIIGTYTDANSANHLVVGLSSSGSYVANAQSQGFNWFFPNGTSGQTFTELTDLYGDIATEVNSSTVQTANSLLNLGLIPLASAISSNATTAQIEDNYLIPAVQDAGILERAAKQYNYAAPALSGSTTYLPQYGAAIQAGGSGTLLYFSGGTPAGSITATPEPGSLLAIGLGAASMLFLRRRNLAV